jgi:hypothetical protein
MEAASEPVEAGPPCVAPPPIVAATPLAAACLAGLELDCASAMQACAADCTCSSWVTNCLDTPTEWGIADGCLGGALLDDAGVTMSEIGQCSYGPVPCATAAADCNSYIGPSCPASYSAGLLGQSCSPLGSSCAYLVWNDATGCSGSSIACSPAGGADAGAGDAGSGIWTATPHP